MKTVGTTVAILAALAATALASASTVLVNQGLYQVGEGGEFEITPSGNVGSTGLFSDVSPTTFQTFCLEGNEGIRFGHTYHAVINTMAVNGGSGGGNPDPLDARTAYLYWHFRNGTLAGYDYGAGRQSSALALQQAMWYIEDEAGGVNNAFVALAKGAVNSGAWSGLGNVRVLNLTDTTDGSIAQDILTVVPAPAALILGALGLLGAFALKRKLS